MSGEWCLQGEGCRLQERLILIGECLLKVRLMNDSPNNVILLSMTLIYVRLFLSRGVSIRHGISQVSQGIL